MVTENNCGMCSRTQRIEVRVVTGKLTENGRQGNPEVVQATGERDGNFDGDGDVRSCDGKVTAEGLCGW